MTARAALQHYDPSFLPTEYDVEWLNTADLEPLAADWRALAARVRHRTHLSTFDFLAPWYRARCIATVAVNPALNARLSR